MTRCPACGSRLTADRVPGPGGSSWSACEMCGSEANHLPYDPESYGKVYTAGLLADEGADPEANHQHNADLFEPFTGPPAGRRLLDAGCGAGTSLVVLRSRGWVAVGWDVTGEGRPAGTLVSPYPDPGATGGGFAAVLSREVLEHTPRPLPYLAAVAASLDRGGVLQLTTPRPIADRAEMRVYQPHHLCVWTRTALDAAVARLGLEILTHEEWGLGQRLVARRH